MREFERVGPGILGEASTPPAIEGALEAAYQATLADFLAPIEEAAGAAAAAAAKHRVAEFGVSFAFDLKNPRAIAAIKAQAAASVEEIDATTRDDLTRILTQGMEEGYNYQQVARAIAAKYDESTPKGKLINCKTLTTIKKRITAKEKTIFCFIILPVCLDIPIMKGTRHKLFFTKIISAVSIATSVPLPIAIPTSEVARAGASLTPSPTIKTFLPWLCKSLIISSLSTGNKFALT